MASRTKGSGHKASSPTSEEMVRRGRLGWEALKAKLLAKGGKKALSAEMARRGARGFAMYAHRHHGGNAERAAFALAKAGKMEAFPTPAPYNLPENPTRVCLCNDTNFSASRCPTCNGYTVPF